MNLIWVPAAQKNVIVIISCERDVHYVFLSHLFETCEETCNSRRNSCVSFPCVVKGLCYGECFMIPAKDKKESNCSSLWLLYNTLKAHSQFIYLF